MSRRIISQREARRLQNRVAALEAREASRRNSWASDYPGGVHFHTVQVIDVTRTAVDVARKLGHAVVVTMDGNNLRLYALPERRTDG